MTGKVNETWPGDTWKFGGGRDWLGGTYDPERNLVYFGTGKPRAMETRPCGPATTSGTASRLAINRTTGDDRLGLPGPAA